MSKPFHPLTPQDIRYLRQYLERLGSRRVRLMTAIDCDRFFGDWQVREEIDRWLEEGDLAAAAARGWLARAAACFSPRRNRAGAIPDGAVATRSADSVQGGGD
jgi:hypothetical protein